MKIKSKELGKYCSKVILTDVKCLLMFKNINLYL